MLDIGITGLLTLFASGLGAWFLARVNIRSDSMLKDFVYAATLGYLFLADIIFILGSLGILRVSVFVGLLVILGAATYRYAWHWLREAWKCLRSWSWSSLSGFERTLMILIGLFAGGYLLMALSPPISGYSVHYELPAAQTYVRAHNIHFIPYLFALRPQNMILPYMAGLLLRTDFAVQMIGYVFLWLTMFMVYALTRRLGSRTSALLAVAIFMSMPMIGYVSDTVSSEPGVFLYGFLALCALLEWWETRRVRWLILAGGFSGFCAGVKITGIEIPLVLGLLMLGRLWPSTSIETDAANTALLSSLRQSFLVFLLSTGVFAAAVTVTALPWYYQIYRWTGSPIYSGENPEQLISRHFPQLESAKSSGTRASGMENSSVPNPSEAATSSRVLNYIRTGLGSLTRFGPKTLLEFAWKMSMCRDFQSTPTSPLFLAFLPFLLLFRTKTGRGIQLLGVFSFVYFIIGINLWGDYSRYIIPIFPVLSVMTATTVGNIAESNRNLGVFSTWIAGGMICLYLPVTLHTGLRQASVVFGREDRAMYLEQNFPGSFAVAEYARQHLPKTAKLLLIGEYNQFLFHRDYLLGDGTPDTLDFQFSLVMQYRHFQDPEQAHERLQRLGVTHVIVNQRVSNNSGYQDTLHYIEHFTRQYLEEIYHNAGVFVYRLK